MLKLMIVDDSNIIRRKIERAQQGSHIQVVATARNGNDALAEFKKHQPDVVTMDLTMPEMDGIECIEELMKLNPETLILVISALSDKATGIEALHKGARGFLCKPFDEEKLGNALKELTEGLHV
ncbi:response regulator [Hahella sp. CCB-MM4]|uniref:response regulator n=1 Tax=Hahella sp. (strain CCB-MM4) TaxID=1926491 RepID=UPI000B9B7DE4|nr:response regulator [Hahella sp. CCB-MM4]OZG71635.1 response regulator [Hahella sp. CCB-MM4]